MGGGGSEEATGLTQVNRTWLGGPEWTGLQGHTCVMKEKDEEDERNTLLSDDERFHRYLNVLCLLYY